MVVGVDAGEALGLVARHVHHALVGLEVVLHPELLALGVDPHVGVRAVAVHVPPAQRQAAVTHQVGDLVGGLGVEGPEVPLHVGVAQAGGGQALLRADEVRELHRVAQEEDRGVVADDVEVALGGVELQREAAHVAPGVGGALLARHGGEARQHLGLDARLEHRGLGVARDVLGGLEDTEGARPLGVRVALRYPLAVEVREGLHEPYVVQQQRAVAAQAQRVAVADGGGAVLLGARGGAWPVGLGHFDLLHETGVGRHEGQWPQ